MFHVEAHSSFLIRLRFQPAARLFTGLNQDLKYFVFLQQRFTEHLMKISWLTLPIRSCEMLPTPGRVDHFGFQRQFYCATHKNITVRSFDLGVLGKVQRSEERRVGKECRSRWS